MMMGGGLDLHATTQRLLLLLLLGVARIGLCLRVSGVMVPPVVRSGSEVELVCNYRHSPDRQDPLYSIKWYRDVNQFYEYIPRREPAVRVYDLPHIHVDKQRSDKAKVTITGVTRETSGSFRCEVMGDKPFFETDDKAVNMTVVDVPQWGPKIAGIADRTRIKPGSLITAQCLLGASDPPADMAWTINGFEAPPHAYLHRSTQRDTHGKPLQVSELQVTATEDWLERGAMTLSCHAQVMSVFHVITNLTLTHSDWPQPAEFGWFANGAQTPSPLLGLLLLLPLLTLLPVPL